MSKSLYFYVKKIVDVLMALVLLIICLIPGLLVALAIRLESKGPVLFKQRRTGYKGKEFNLYKFRSMCKDNNVLDFTKGDKLTKVGKFIRKTSLDEIPQLINILKGEMSFIGPRPWITEYVNYFTEEQKHRLDVLPGITGLAQACGRNSISIIDKINYDLKYVNNYSFIVDIKVVYWTIKTVLSKEGAELGKGGIKDELDELKENKKNYVPKKKAMILAHNANDVYKLRKELISKLQKENYNVVFCAPFDQMVHTIADAGCKFVDVNFNRKGMNPFKDVKLVLRYRNIILKERPDVVLSYAIKPNIYGGFACRLTKTEYIANITGLGQVFQKESILQKMIIILYKIAFKNIKCIFFQNDGNKKVFEKNKIALGKYRVIPGSGVNLEEFKYEKFPSNNKKIEFVFISRIIKEKGIEEYIELASKITKKYDNVIFNVIGKCEGDYEEILQSLHKKNIIKFHGLIKDVKPYIKKSSCLILPSYYPEGMANVLLEASAIGRPVITTNQYGCKETVENNKTGYIIPIKDSKELIKAVEKFLSLPHIKKQSMGLAARKKMEIEFDRNIIIENYISVIGKDLN